MAALCAVAALAGGVWIASGGPVRTPPPAPPEQVAAPPPVWTAIPRPVRLIGWELVGEQATEVYSARRREADGAREDAITIGRPEDASRTHARVTLTRNAAGAPTPSPSGSFYLSLARRAAEVGVATRRASPPVAALSKFGAIETADTLLAVGEVERPCLAFRRVEDGGAHALDGWWCPPQGQEPTRPGLACALDRLSLLAAGEDKALRALFVAAEKRRTDGCVSGRLAASRPAAGWLREGAAPRLRP